VNSRQFSVRSAIVITPRLRRTLLFTFAKNAVANIYNIFHAHVDKLATKEQSLSREFKVLKI
jgi:hypothetical protein